MKPLGILKFIYGYKGRFLMLLIVSSMLVFIIYFLLLIKKQTINEVDAMALTPYNNMSVIVPNNSVLSSDIFHKVEDMPTVAKICKIKYESIFVRTVFGTGTSASIILSGKNDLKKLQKAQNLKLIEGEMPDKIGEILLHKKIAKFYNLKPGMTVKKNDKRFQISMDMQISGIIDGDPVMGMGIINIDNVDHTETGILILPKDKPIKKMNRQLQKILTSEMEFRDIEGRSAVINKAMSGIRQFANILGIILMFIVGILIININYINYHGRRKEVGILFAIGYTKVRILFRILHENVFYAVVGYVVGILLEVLLAYCLNRFVWNNVSIGIALIDFDSLLFVTVVPLFICLTGFVSPALILMKSDPLMIVEGNT